MTRIGEQRRADFEQAVGECFAECVSPPVPFEDVSAHECCEPVWAVAGRHVTPRSLASLTEDQIDSLSKKIGDWFNSPAPAVEQVREAIARTLTRWPIGSLGD
jgi:hypothetical protein